MQIKEILRFGVKSISIEASMIDAQKILQEHNFRHLPVSDGKTLVGILSDRDIQRAMTVIISGENKKQHVIQEHKKIADYMSTPIHRMKLTDPVLKLVKDMISHKVSCFIIQDEAARDVGIITTEDLLILLLDFLDKKTGPLTILKKMFGIKS